MAFPQFWFSSNPTISSATPQNPPITAPIGASVAQIGRDQYNIHTHFIKWIEETKQKLPNANPFLRREAFLADPLLKGTIFPYLKNVLLSGFDIKTSDNKLYADAIKDIETGLQTISLMDIFREDFLDFAILTGHSYRRIDYDSEGNIVRLAKVDSSAVTAYSDPWDPTITAYHQHATIRTSWSKSATTQEVDSWFVPYRQGADINSGFVQGKQDGNDPKVLTLFEQYKADYHITDIQNLRVGAAERIIAMHNTEMIQAASTYYAVTNQEIENPAPIDTVILAIWLKRLLLSTSPNLIYIVLSPFLHLISGVMTEATDTMGNKKIEPSTPPYPSEYLKTINPDQYNQAMSDYENWIKSLHIASNNLLNCEKEGGVYASGPDQQIKPIESSRSSSFTMVKGLNDLLDEEIGQAFGFPMSLVKATGTELASARSITQIFNDVHAGKRMEYETVANKIIGLMFAGRTWQGTTIKNGKEVTVEYSFEDTQAEFVLDVPDTKDLLQEAQAINSKADTLNKLKAVGASKDDLIALGDEYGFGMLGLDNYGAAVAQAGTQEGEAGVNAAQVNAIVSAGPTDPSGFDDTALIKKAQDAYKTAKETIDKLFEEE